MDGLTLLNRAREAGLAVAAEGDKLVIRGPRRAESVARLLIEHKPEVLAALAPVMPPPDLRIDPAWWRRHFNIRTIHWALSGGRWTKVEAERLAYGELLNEWRKSRGRRGPAWQCAGCDGPIGGCLRSFYPMNTASTSTRSANASFALVVAGAAKRLPHCRRSDSIRQPASNCCNRGALWPENGILRLSHPCPRCRNCRKAWRPPQEPMPRRSVPRSSSITAAFRANGRRDSPRLHLERPPGDVPPKPTWGCSSTVLSVLSPRRSAGDPTAATAIGHMRGSIKPACSGCSTATGWLLCPRTRRRSSPAPSTRQTYRRRPSELGQVLAWEAAR